MREFCLESHPRGGRWLLRWGGGIGCGTCLLGGAPLSRNPPSVRSFRSYPLICGIVAALCLLVSHSWGQRCDCVGLLLFARYNNCNTRISNPTTGRSSSSSFIPPVLPRTTRPTVHTPILARMTVFGSLHQRETRLALSHPRYSYTRALRNRRIN